MNSKEFKAEKKLNKKKSNLKNGQQIFVLPPNLLQKLGINLGNVGSTPISPDMGWKMSTCAPGHKYGHSSLNVQHEINSNVTDTETSIRKTASLMTESVFLSPTFNNSNNVTNSHVGGHVELCNNEVIDASEKCNKKNNENINTSNVTLKQNFLNNKKQEYKHDNAYDLGVSVENNAIEINGPKTLEKCILQSETKKVINIISEETVTVEKLNELNVLQVPSTNSMIPASLDTIIGKKYKNNSVLQSLNLPISNENSLDHIQYTSDDKSDCSTEKLNNSDCNVKDVLNFITNDQVSDDHNINDKEAQTIELNKSYNNDNSELVNTNSVDPVIENKFDYSQNHLGIMDKEKESMSDNPEFFEDIKSTPIYEAYPKQQNNNNTLLIDNSDIVNQVCNNNLKVLKLDHTAQNVESFLPDIFYMNNNNWDNKTFDVDQNEPVMDENPANFDKSQLEKIDTITSKTVKHVEDECKSNFNTASKQQNNILNDPEKYTSVTHEINKNMSVTEQDIKLDIVDDTTFLSENLKSVTNQLFPGITDVGGITKLGLSLNPKRNNLISKLCIQGVEKPGGIIMDIQKTESLKTYSNKRNKIHSKELASKEKFDMKFDNNCEIDLNEANFNNSPPCQQFCKCNDYGILAYNEIETTYEHIHFKWRIPLDCNPDIIFDMYNDNEIINIEGTRENIDHIENDIDQMDPGCPGHSICWYNGDSVQNNIDMDFENSQNQESNKLDTQNLSRKRKMSNNSHEMTDIKRVKNSLNHEVNKRMAGNTQQKEQVVEFGFEGCKVVDEIPNDVNEQQNVKCGVCGINVINTDWTTHIASSHDYIAWKEGEPPVNLEDDDAIRDYLQHMVQVLGHLECSRCGLIRKYAKSFLHHIRACYNSSDENAERQPPYYLSKGPDIVINCEHCEFKCNNSKEYATHIERCIRIPELIDQPSSDNDDDEDPKSVTCGVCKEEVTSQQWLNHIQREHNYKAWPEGEAPLNVQDEASVRKHLYSILQKHGPLVCSKCGKSRKYVKLFLQHIQTCTGPKDQDETLETSFAELDSILDTSLDDTETEGTNVVKCGLCRLDMQSKHWIDHIQKEHNYLSWQEGKTPLNICDEEIVRRYLYIVVQRLGSLVCAKCGVARKYVKNYLSHIETCKGPLESDINTINNPSVSGRPSLDVDGDVTVDVSSQRRNTTLPLGTAPRVPPATTVKCGVCQKEMTDSKWITHIGMSHEYMAWKETDPPIDLSNYDAVYQHLTNIIRDIGALKCADCGKKCKYAKTYLFHVKNCYGITCAPIDDGDNTVNDSASDTEASCIDDTTVVKCGVCSEEIQERHWIDHIQKQHNYMAWRDGDIPLDLEDKVIIRSHLKSIVLKIKRLTCNKCGLRRRKVIPFYNHIKSCDGTAQSSDESLESLTTKPETNDSKEIVKCAVCQNEMPDASWYDHIAKEHDYLAWKDGDEPLNIDDETSIKDHLYKIIQNVNELICNKCGESRKYVRSYLQHTRGCTGSAESTNSTFKAPKPKEESDVVVTCALCLQEMKNSMWMEHISREHNYVSWKQNERPLVFKDEKSLRDHLYNIVQSIGSLVCSKCGLVRKYAKAYMMHIETCQNVTWKSIDQMIMKLKKEKGDIVRCAVCSMEMDDTEWIKHIASQHNYLAWRDRDPAIDLEDEDSVRNHLKNIMQYEGYLRCPKCGVKRKYAKLYLQHVNTCDGSKEENYDMNDSTNETELPSDDTEEADQDGSVIVKCGVCEQDVVKSAWLMHIQKEHKYLAWEAGKKPIDLNNKEAVYNHLNAINMKCKGLTCNSCGLVRKYVKSYLHHVQDCKERNYAYSNESVECGVCGEKMEGKLWRDHAMHMHYNLAWIVGENPIDLRNFFTVDKYLKEYHEYKHKLVCNICGLCRASLAGFYAHVLVCGKTDEEVDKWKDVCDICNQKYLCIYKTQHYWTHKVQEIAKERKIKDKLKKSEYINDDINSTPGRRRAAEKARSVIGDYAAKLELNKCKYCIFESESKEELANHHCSKRAVDTNEDSDDSVSIKFEDCSDEESDDTDIDSNLSNEDEESTVLPETKKRNRNDMKLTTKTSKFPFVVKDVKPYLQQSKIDHFKLYYTRETLFTHWRDCAYEVVPSELIPQYLPQLEVSCKVNISNGGWNTYKRFESKKEKGCTVMFTGGSIQCIAWAPEHPDSTPACHSLLAVATHRGPDCPRLECTDTPSHPALIQLWNFHNFKSVPELAFGLAHDYGTVWSMDWCPSGARDSSDGVDSDDKNRPRLGLLALACSNGSAYVVSVPYPDKIRTSDVLCYKIKPCVELRVTRGCSKYQATSINWSLFKGYTTISVGYGDGTVALYDLVTESPLLTAKEGDINILYPFQDERVHNSCVTGVTSSVLGAWCSSSVTGSTAGVAGSEQLAGRGERPLRAHSALAASAATFMPHWPNVMLSGDDTIVGLSPSELEWGYIGRRVGSVRALAPCAYRARIAAVVPPLLQVMRPHPAAFKGHKTIHKKNVAMLEMTPLAKKRPKHSNDELSMKVEPITYEDAIASYGIEFKFERDFDKAFVQRVQQKHRVPFPERFPLGDVPAVAYCPAAAHYTKLALASHSGLLFLLDV